MPPRACCEHGYALFREGLRTWLLGHAGIFHGCEGRHDHSDDGTHSVWESLKSDGEGVQRTSLTSFKYHISGAQRTRSFWGIRTIPEGLTPVQRRFIIEEARKRRGVKWHFFYWNDPQVGLRCDGLVCLAYEQAGIDLGFREWFQCSPLRLFNRLACVP